METNFDNIFENAKFGDKFLTRDGRIAIITDIRENCIDLFVEKGLHKVWGEFSYATVNNGKFDDSKFDALDIVSRYKEPINEEKLDELANNYILKNEYVKSNKNIPTPDRFIYEAYKAGYRKAMEE